VKQVLEHRTGRVALALASGVLFYISFGLTPSWAAARCAPLPILLAVLYADRREAVRLAWLAAAIGVSSNATYYLTTTGPVATPIILALEAAAWAFVLLRARAVILASRSWLVVFAFPILLAAVDTLVSTLSPHGTWGSIAYTQMDSLPIVQVASLFGAPAIAFLLGLAPSALAVAVYRGTRIDRPRLAYGLPAATLVAALAWGSWRIGAADPTRTVDVGVAAIDRFTSARTSAARADSVWRGYDSAVTLLAQEGAKIVVLPEKISVLRDSEVAPREQALGALAARTGVSLVAGVQIDRVARNENVAWLFTPGGALAGEYLKRRMVPHLESDLTPGSADLVRTIDGLPFGVAICRDLIFADIGRRYGRLGVSALLVPAWDFYRDAWMASAVARLRGVESGYAVVRAGRESYLAVSDRYGRVLIRTRSTALPGTALVVPLPLEVARPTLYAETGDVFGWLSVLVAVLGLVATRRRRVTTGPSGDSAVLPEVAATAA